MTIEEALKTLCVHTPCRGNCYNCWLYERSAIIEKKPYILERRAEDIKVYINGRWWRLDEIIKIISEVV